MNQDRILEMLDEGWKLQFSPHLVTWRLRKAKNIFLVESRQVQKLKDQKRIIRANDEAGWQTWVKG